nr:MAG: hypothetical protein DIU78_25650 [Pseudomonadota bacterium]
MCAFIVRSRWIFDSSRERIPPDSPAMYDARFCASHARHSLGSLPCGSCPAGGAPFDAGFAHFGAFFTVSVRRGVEADASARGVRRASEGACGISVSVANSRPIPCDENARAHRVNSV